MNSTDEQDIYESEKNVAIGYILDKGLIKPRSTYKCILDMVHQVGLRYIFWDTWYSIFFAVVTIAGAAFFYVSAPDDLRYSTAVATAPLSFLVIAMFAEITERLSGLYELKQTCRYTIRQITALRMVCYSIAGLVFTTAISVFTAQDISEFLPLFILCLAALLLCAALSLIVMRFIRSPWATAALSGGWITVNTFLSMSGSIRWEATLNTMTMIIPGIIATTSAALFIYQASKLIKENNNYAHA